MERIVRGNTGYLQMKTDSDFGAATELLSSDLKDVGSAIELGFGTSLLQWVACFAAIYLLVLDRTNWKTNMLTALLIPYIYLTLPEPLFYILSGEIGKWIAFVVVVLRLFFPKHFPEWLEMPGSLILLIVVAPTFFSYDVRYGIIGLFICLVMGCYLLQEHIRACGGFRNSFTNTNGLSNSIGILLLFVYPVSALVLAIL